MLRAARRGQYCTSHQTVSSIISSTCGPGPCRDLQRRSSDELQDFCCVNSLIRSDPSTQFWRRVSRIVVLLNVYNHRNQQQRDARSSCLLPEPPPSLIFSYASTAAPSRCSSVSETLVLTAALTVSNDPTVNVSFFCLFHFSFFSFSLSLKYF